MDTDTEKKPTVRTGSVLSSQVPGENAVNIVGLNEDERDKVVGAINAGSHWISVDETGRLVTHQRHKPLPDPVEDSKMLPFWRPHEESPGTLVVQTTMFDEMRAKESAGYCSFLIQHLCGYYYTPKKYEEVGKNLTEWGFACMRSRREEDGQYWEIWFLPGLFAAKGALRDAVGDDPRVDQAAKVEIALRFLSRNSSFGTLDLVVQRLAMPVPD